MDKNRSGIEIPTYLPTYLPTYQTSCIKINKYVIENIMYIERLMNNKVIINRILMDKERRRRRRRIGVKELTG